MCEDREKSPLLQFFCYLCHMKRLLLFLTLFISVTAGAQHAQGLKVISHKITSAWPSSLRSVKGKAQAVVKNTGKVRTFSDVQALVYRNGEPFVEGTCSDVAVARGQATYPLLGEVSLFRGRSVWDAVKAAVNFDAGEYTVDISMQVVYPDTTVTVTRTGIPLTKYLKR